MFGLFFESEYFGMEVGAGSTATIVKLPCPFAPETSGQMAHYPPSGAGLIIAVNSHFIVSLFLTEQFAMNCEIARLLSKHPPLARM